MVHNSEKGDNTFKFLQHHLVGKKSPIMIILQSYKMHLVVKISSAFLHALQQMLVKQLAPRLKVGHYEY